MNKKNKSLNESSFMLGYQSVLLSSNRQLAKNNAILKRTLENYMAVYRECQNIIFDCSMTFKQCKAVFQRTLEKLKCSPDMCDDQEIVDDIEIISEDVSKLLCRCNQHSKTADQRATTGKENSLSGQRVTSRKKKNLSSQTTISENTQIIQEMIETPLGVTMKDECVHEQSTHVVPYNLRKRSYHKPEDPFLDASCLQCSMAWNETLVEPGDTTFVLSKDKPKTTGKKQKGKKPTKTSKSAKSAMPTVKKRGIQKN